MVLAIRTRKLPAAVNALRGCLEAIDTVRAPSFADGLVEGVPSLRPTDSFRVPPPCRRRNSRKHPFLHRSNAYPQLNNWMHFILLSGDQVCEQAVHNIDTINEVMGDNPVAAYGTGGRFKRPAASEM